MSRIAVVGSINADFVLDVQTLPAPGQTVASSASRWLPGGKGANQAVAAARLGAHTFMHGAVGNDDAGQMCLSALQDNNVDTAHMQRVATLTGTAVVVVEESGENLIVISPGANEEAIPADVSNADAVILQHEIPASANLAAARAAHGLVVLNAAPVREVPNEMWDHVDVLVVNQHEHAAYGRTEGLVVVTLGADGAVAYRDGIEVARALPPAVNVVDTVGAGDTFTAALTVALVRGDDIQRAIRWAVTAGALATQAPGAQSAMPTSQEVDARCV
jgi:ribokinase